MDNIKEKFQNVMKKRDQYSVESPEWNNLNEQKADLLEAMKPSTKENIIYFEEKDMGFIKENFDELKYIPNIPFKVERRSILEYHPNKRHPIPYCIIRYEDKYFFILRESGSGEIRLIGKKGLIGGHIGDEDVIENNLSKTIENGLIREFEEEIGETKDIIKNISLKGVIKSNNGVDADHLGLLYEIEVDKDDIKAAEKGVLKGIWIDKADLPNHYDSFESWSQIAYTQILSKN